MRVFMCAGVTSRIIRENADDRMVTVLQCGIRASLEEVAGTLEPACLPGECEFVGRCGDEYVN